MNDLNEKEQTGFKVTGLVEITDITDPEHHQVLLKKNAIHDGNMVYNIAKAMIGQDSNNTSAIGWFAFGDGGTQISDTGKITYRPTNTTKYRNEIADLYQRVFQKNIKDEGFEMKVSPVVHPTAISDIKVSLILQQGEPFGQLPMDNSVEFSDKFVFDEIGLFSNTDSIDDSYMLTHIVFHPIQKSLNRVLEISYTIRFEII